MTLKGFMKQNALQPANKKVVISDRFLGDDGKPMEWELRPVTERENTAIKESCTHRDFSKKARREGKSVDFESTRYVQKLLAASVVFPDLKDAELQASYGVVGEESLLVEMLYSPEYAALTEEVDSFNGFISRERDGMEEDKDEVKNS